MNKAIKQIEQVYVMSGDEKSLIDIVWSPILVKSNQYTVEGFDFDEINYISALLCSIIINSFVCLGQNVLIKLVLKNVYFYYFLNNLNNYI